VSFLYQRGYKISKLANLTDNELKDEAKKIALDEISNNYQINSLIVSMYTFDTELFNQVYSDQIVHMSFENIFTHTYLPLLNHIGVLWQTGSIKPAQEHFISNLIYQKIALNSESLVSKVTDQSHVFILFLPEGELHEIGLFFLNYYLKLKGKKTIYLGRSIPSQNLFDLSSQFKKVTWITHFLINKTPEEKIKFVEQQNKLLLHSNNNCLIFGKIWEDFNEKQVNKHILFYNKFSDFTTFI
jgi:methanogenic corrinoid protein MtbC1